MKNTTKQNSLDHYRDDISRCVRCGACSAVCPSFLADRRESRSPRGRMALVEAVLKRALPVSDVFRDRLATCTGCLACEAACASGVPVTAIIGAAKEQAVREGGKGIVSAVIAASLRHPGVMRSLAWLAPVALHYGRDSVRGDEDRVRSAECGVRSGNHKTKVKGRIAFYPGCAVRYFQRDIEAATTAVLEALGYEVVIPEGLQCCGRPFLSLGDRDRAVELARKNRDLMASLDVDAIVTSCASCGLTFKKDYPDLLDAASAPVVQDIHEFLAGRLGGLDLDGREVCVTWHDPCHLGRGQGLAKTARSVLRSVPGLTLVEMKEPERCCGFGGVMRATHPGLSGEIGEAKARDIMGTGASLVVTGCPGCRMQIADSLRRNGSELPVVHTVQVLAEALRSADCGVRNGRRSRGTELCKT